MKAEPIGLAVVAAVPGPLHTVSESRVFGVFILALQTSRAVSPWCR